MDKTQFTDEMTLYLTEERLNQIINDIDNNDMDSFNRLTSLSKKFLVIEDRDTSDEYMDRVIRLGYRLIDKCNFPLYQKLISCNPRTAYFADCNMTSTLNYAIQNDTPILDKIIAMGTAYDFDPIIVDKSPIWAAIEYGNHNAFCHIQDICISQTGHMAPSTYYTCLQHAVFVQDIELVKIIVEKYGVTDLEETGCEDMKPLSLAVLGVNYEMVDYLLSKGADPNGVDNRGLSPLDICVNKPIEELLIKYGGKHSDRETLLYGNMTSDLSEELLEAAEKEYLMFVEDYDLFAHDVHSLLESAVFNRSVLMVKDIISRIGDVKDTESNLLNTCLRHKRNRQISFRECINVFEILVDAGLRISKTSYTNPANTVAYSTMEETASKEDCIRFFDLAYKAGMLNEPEMVIKEALSCANELLLDYIVERSGCCYSIEQFDHEHGFVEHLFRHTMCCNDNSLVDRKRILSRFVEEGKINVNRTDKHGNTVLHLISYSGSSDNSGEIEILMQYIDKTTKNKLGQYPVDVAKENGRPQKEIELLEV